MIKPDILEALEREGLELHKAGSLYKALCPLHNESTPSFTVRQDKQSFCCYGCGKSGDIVDFIKYKYNMTFKEALDYLKIKGGQPGKDYNNKKDLLARFRKWERAQFLSLVKEYRDLIWEIENVKVDWELEVKYNYYHRLPVVEWQLDVLIEGSNEDKNKLRRWRDEKEK